MVPCSNCGTPNSAQATHCSVCGAKIGSSRSNLFNYVILTGISLFIVVLILDNLKALPTYISFILGVITSIMTGVGLIERFHIPWSTVKKPRIIWPTLATVALITAVFFHDALFQWGVSVVTSVTAGVHSDATSIATQMYREWVFSAGDHISSSPIVVNGVVYIGSYDKKVYAIDASTGQQKWAFTTGGSLLQTLTVVNGIVYAGSYDHKVYALDASTGHQKWFFTASGYLETGPQVINGILYVGYGETYQTPNVYKVYALDASTGHQKWVFPIGSEVPELMVVNGIVYAGSSSTVYAIDASNGRQKWTYAANQELFSFAAVANGVLYISAGDYRVYAIDANTGQQKWVFPPTSSQHVAPGFFYPTVANGMLYVGSSDKKLHALDASTGQQKWAFSIGDYVEAPVIQSGILYIGSNGRVYALDANTGQQKWASTIPNGLFLLSAVVNGIVYVNSQDELYALDASTGQEKWFFSVKIDEFSGLTVLNGVVYVCSLDHKVYALKLPPSSS